ncbi:hypothetical protein Naga_101114g2 [Nannochloropsis gaditana]|uniref:Uncharacterized protein n=1 Tax=Nannochloropsis gaditana TaxID=72520 RepID=W7TJ97_9STRA|nr:hypothetical protein Naga_101114g2 [Nannochloropsis gaditana]
MPQNKYNTYDYLMAVYDWLYPPPLPPPPPPPTLVERATDQLTQAWAVTKHYASIYSSLAVPIVASLLLLLLPLFIFLWSNGPPAAVMEATPEESHPEKVTDEVVGGEREEVEVAAREGVASEGKTPETEWNEEEDGASKETVWKGGEGEGPVESGKEEGMPKAVVSSPDTSPISSSSLPSAPSSLSSSPLVLEGRGQGGGAGPEIAGGEPTQEGGSGTEPAPLTTRTLTPRAEAAQEAPEVAGEGCCGGGREGGREGRCGCQVSEEKGVEPEGGQGPKERRKEGGRERGGIKQVPLRVLVGSGTGTGRKLAEVFQVGREGGREGRRKGRVEETGAIHLIGVEEYHSTAPSSLLLPLFPRRKRPSP